MSSGVSSQLLVFGNSRSVSVSVFVVEVHIGQVGPRLGERRSHRVTARTDSCERQSFVGLGSRSLVGRLPEFESWL